MTAPSGRDIVERMDLDIRGVATELFVEAAAKLSEADPAELVGANRLLPKLLAIDETPDLKQAFRDLGLEISGRVRAFLVAIGEEDLADDIASTGFIAAAALAFVTEEEIANG